MNFQKIFCGELYRFGGINDLDLTNFQIPAHHKKFPKEHVTYTWLKRDLLILMDL